MPVVTITISKGRNYEQKKRMTEEITRALTTTLGVPVEKVTILIHELDRENIALQGTLLSEQK
jgi:4-oxalocrotonate tautomerase